MNRLISELSRLPGIGQRTAQRLAFHLLRQENGEALALADALELPREAAFEVLMKTRLAPQVERNRPAIQSGEYPRRFALSLARKDAGLILDAAERAGIDLRLTASARSWLEDAERAGLGDSDYSAVLQQILSARSPRRER